MSVNKHISIESAIKDIFEKHLIDVIAGLESIFLVDLETGEVVVAYPERESQDSKFIAEICGVITIQIEQRAKKVRSALALTSMEIRTEGVDGEDNRRIATYRITNTWLICLLGKEETFRPAFAKRLCEGPIKDEIENLLIQYNIVG